MAGRNRKIGTTLILIALILMIGLGAAAYLFKDQLFPQASPLPNTSNQATPPAETIDIVILVQPVKLGGIISKEMVDKFPFPKEKYIPGFYFKDFEEVIGKRSRYPLDPPLVLTSGLLSNSPVGSFASSLIPPGYVAISVPINMVTAIPTAILPGDHVTVIAAILLEDLDQNFQTKLPNYTADVQAPGKPGESPTIPKTLKITSGGNTSSQGRTELDPILNQPIYIQPSEEQRPRLVSQVLIPDAIVLGRGDMTEATKASIEPGRTSATPTPVPSTTVTPTPVTNQALNNHITLIVNPQEAVTLNYAMLNPGIKLNLVLRSAKETKQYKTEAVTLQFLLDQYSIPLPSKLPYGIGSPKFFNEVQTPVPQQK